MPKILLVDDDHIFCEAVSQMLISFGHSVEIAANLSEARDALGQSSFDRVLLDFMLPDGSGLHLVDELKSDASSPFITLITGHPSVRTMISGLCNSKVNYLIKPLSLEDLRNLIDGKPDPKSSQLSYPTHFGCLIGESEAMHKVYKMIERVSRTQANVMLLGESGSGKEVIAQAIHNASGCANPLVAANCGAFSRELIGSELFGHEKGAFTGAIARKSGLFEQAIDSTLFLDEITEMPIDLQPNLLRVLETGKVTRVGGTKNLDVNCRVISATNRSLEELAHDEVIREDLYFRLAVFPIQIPPLREREGDVELLTKAFLEQFNFESGTNFAINNNQLQRLNDHDWPGNVRELRHVLHRAVIMSDPTCQNIELPDCIKSPFTRYKKVSNVITPGQKIEDLEHELISATLESLDGDKPKAAEMLGISLKTLYNRLNKYEESVN